MSSFSPFGNNRPCISPSCSSVDMSPNYISLSTIHSQGKLRLRAQHRSRQSRPDMSIIPKTNTRMTADFASSALPPQFLGCSPSSQCPQKSVGIFFYLFFLLCWLCVTTRFCRQLFEVSARRCRLLQCLGKKHLKDIKQFGSDFKWKLYRGVKWAWGGSHFLLFCSVLKQLALKESRMAYFTKNIKIYIYL